ncbi:tetratricopeptide repeat protein (macronuclear) [Tetrahymena thermophila SB210]|uniref:Tetratricopeptide repeat protein n=1 Tax=Tetrahymena thermophila (strain SB210) TaxID=312017 RepID=Q24CZ3_TETTS|nr:tetratricopeptide repeat protein [Tetrahymena thermophila SB210]EAS05615.3 tetratricopeptide repeat protein [Tetrahymena thermophila SB210]|eukprot:XP_001025860.3 tetratricopeptide repeat protein [Tetrahymena thermophila SB210]
MHEDAKKFFEKAIELNPQLGEAYMYLGAISQQKGMIEESKELLLKAIQLDDKCYSAHMYIANYYLATNQVKKAIKSCEKALKIGPINHWAYHVLGMCYYRQQDLEKAKTYYYKAIELNSKVKEPFLNLGNIYLEQNMKKEAIECYENALKLNTKKEDLYYIYTQLGQANYFINEKEAIKYLKLAIQIKPDIKSFYLLAMSYISLDKIEEAKECYLKVLEGDPHSLDKYEYLFSMPLSNQQWQRVKKGLEKSLKQNDDNPFIYYFLSQACAYLSLIDEAILYGEMYLEYYPFNFFTPDEALYKKASIYHFLITFGNRDSTEKDNLIQEAKECFQKYSLLMLSHFNVSLGFVNILQGNVKESIKIFQEYMKTYPHYQHVNFLTGISYYLEGITDKAQYHFENCLNTNPKHKDAIYNLGIVYDKLKNQDMARHFYKKAFEINPSFKEVQQKINLNYDPNNKPQITEELKNICIKAIEGENIFIQSFSVELFQVAIIYALLDMKKEALKFCDYAIINNLLFADAYCLKATILTELGQNQEAKEFFEKAKKLRNF